MFKASRKGFGSVVSTLILFIAIVGVSTGLVVSFQNFVVETQDSLENQNDLTSKKLRTTLSITNVAYNSSSNELLVYVKNTGQTKLTTEFVDLFVDGFYQVGFSTLYATNLSSNMTLLQPQETLAITHTIPLNSGSHEVKISSEYGNSVKDSFNI